MTDTARFYIDVPLDKLDRVEHILNSEDVPFCTTENMVHLPRENLLDSIFTGADGQYAIDKLNSHHAAEGRHERITIEFWQMSPKTRRDLLEFVTMNMDWESEHEPDIAYLDPGRFVEFLQQHPETMGPTSTTRPKRNPTTVKATTPRQELTDYTVRPHPMEKPLTGRRIFCDPPTPQRTRANSASYPNA